MTVAAPVSTRTQKRRRVPNEQRRERYKQWKEAKKISHLSRAAAAATEKRNAPEAEAASQRAVTVESKPAATQAPASNPAPAAEPTAPAQPRTSTLHTSTIETRAKKRRLAYQLSPPSPPPNNVIPQLDGATSPPASPPSPSVRRELPALAYVPAEPNLHSPPPIRGEIEGRGASRAGQSQAALIRPQGPLTPPPPSPPSLPPPMSYAAAAQQNVRRLRITTRPWDGHCKRCGECMYHHI
jgi:hypothetical protein